MRIYTSCAQVHELPQSYCGDNREGTLFSWLHICIVYIYMVYIYIYIYIYILCLVTAPLLAPPKGCL